MSRILLLVIALTISLSTFAQAPKGFKYQAVLRNASNDIIDSKTVGVRLSIQQGSIGGTDVYVETFTPTTNAYGLVNLEIGKGTSSDDFSSIDWANGPYFMETSVDITGGTAYSIVGTSELMSVPYALYAKGAENVVNDSVDDADANPTNELQTITKTGNTITLSNGGGSYQDSVSVYTAGSGISIVNNVVATSNSCNLSIGDTYKGGMVFYIDASGCHGLVCSAIDLSERKYWSIDTIITTAFANCIGCGDGNTRMIVFKGQSPLAAPSCYDLSLNGFSDWYLPSKHELNLMYLHIGQGDILGLGNVGGFADYLYWSSTEYNATRAVNQDFGTGLQWTDKKTFNYNIRAVRAF